MKKILGLLFAALISGCATQYPNKDVTGQVFPTVSGESLSKQAFVIPEFSKGTPAILLIGYKQDAQFDIDRWLIGLDMKAVTTPAYELPTIAGMVPRMFETQINEGMRKGIPKELWGGVITIYQDGDKVQAFTGNQNGNNARVVLLDKDGQIAYFYDRGFAVAPLNELIDKIAQLNNASI
jgi:hypothetical protein